MESPQEQSDLWFTRLSLKAVQEDKWAGEVAYYRRKVKVFLVLKFCEAGLTFQLPLLFPSIFPSIRVFPTSRLFASGGETIGASASVSVLLVNIQG